MIRERFRAVTGSQYLTGISALARLPIDQMRVDRVEGLRTAAFVSGYPGSPLGGYDTELGRVRELLSEYGVVHQPGVNEELAATAVFGSQVASVTDGFRYDGVLGVWYGKSPGLDRAADAVRHGNMAGTGDRSGVVVVVGDDPACKSSTLPSASELMCAELGLPVLHPGDCQDLLDLGHHAVAMSRFSGAWAALKVVTSVADANGTVDVDLSRLRVRLPDLGGPEHRVSPILNQIHSRQLERDLVERRLPRASAYGVANELNRVTVDGPGAWLGVVASGHTYLNVVEAFGLLGLDERDLADLGVRVLQVRMLHPLDTGQLRAFAEGLDEVLVIEEMRSLIEPQLMSALQGRSGVPRVVGRRDPDGQVLVPSTGTLDSDLIAEVLRRRLSVRVDPVRLRPGAGRVEPRSRVNIPVTAARVPWFCSGCPHSTSTKVPAGALVGTGIGCHGLASRMPSERTGTVLSNTQMGGEGAQWVGAAPFIDREHVFQNLGDGTLFHSGWLAIRFAVAARSNITFKILNNGAVAMTGGQQPIGVQALPDLVRGLLAEGVSRVIITTDDVKRYRRSALPSAVSVWDRSRIIEAQETLARVEGVTVLIHDQRCAAELRRDRKRGRVTPPSSRVVIVERVCEGCGDCGTKSACLSVHPIETEFGPKTTIDQTSCNLDFSCLDGDCPSFVLVEPSRRRASPARRPSTRAVTTGKLPDPDLPRFDNEWVVRMPGIGGTGVVTMAQVLGMAASLDGLFVHGLDQTGLSQKAGPVSSDVRISKHPEPRPGQAPGAGVDLFLCFDLVVALAADNLVGLSPDRAALVANTSRTPIGSDIGDPDATQPSLAAIQDAMRPLVRTRSSFWIDAERAVQSSQDDATCANTFLLGFAYQKGYVPVSAGSIEQALTLNGVAVDRNIDAFRLGRSHALDPQQDADGDVTSGSEPASRLTGDLAARISSITDDERLRVLLHNRASDLVGYQNERYAMRYLALVEKVATAERAVCGDVGAFTHAVSTNYHKVLAYKDEYEVARLHLSSEARDAAERVGGPGAKTKILLHPPVLRALGLKRKIALGPTARPLLRLLAAARHLRGTPLDPFGRTQMRRTERQLAADYESGILRLTEQIEHIDLESAVRIASLPAIVRGYEDIKLDSIRRYYQQHEHEWSALQSRPRPQGPVAHHGS